MIALLYVRARDRGALAGWVCLAAGDLGIAACTLPQPRPEQALAQIALRFARPAARDDLLPRAARDLERYFAGERVELDLPLDLTGCGDFTRRVLEVVAAIPYGEMRTYGEVARAAGSPRGARAVGQVMARNPLTPIVPCHRVIAAGGELGGYGGGSALKRYLLEMEGAAPPRGEA